MAKHQASAPQVQTSITYDSGSGRHPTIRIDGNHNEAPTCKRLGQVFVAQVIGNYHISSRTRAGEGVIDSVVTPRGSETLKGAAGSMIAVKKDNQRQFAGESIGHVNLCPDINGDGSNIGVENAGGLIFKGGYRTARVRAGCVRSNLRPGGRRQ